MRDIAVSMIKRHEGLRLKVYTDTVGKPTIGWGRNLEDKGITREEASVLLNNDIAETAAWLNTLPWFDALNIARQAVIMDMAFNLGRHGLLGFPKMIAALAEQNYLHAASEILDSDAGRMLPTRYGELAEIMRAGTI